MPLTFIVLSLKEYRLCLDLTLSPRLASPRLASPCAIRQNQERTDTQTQAHVHKGINITAIFNDFTLRKAIKALRRKGLLSVKSMRKKNIITKREQ